MPQGEFGTVELVWNTRYNTGIQIIDEQHQELFQKAGLLRRLVVEEGDRALLEAKLEDFVACAGHHFATEESFMEKFGYPDLAQHRTEHVSMFGNLHELLTRFQASDQAVALMVPTFMDGWLKQHISGVDFEFVRFLQARSENLRT
jgi:hemerythrin